MMEMKVTMQKPPSFYTKAAASFLRGTEDKPPVPELKILGLGNAIPAAATVASRVSRDGLGMITKVSTAYPDMDSGKDGTVHGCAQLVIEIKNTKELVRREGIARLSAEQVAEIAKTLGNTGHSVRQVVDTLQVSEQSAFNGAELDSMAAAISAMERPADAKPSWLAPGRATNRRGLFFVFEGLDRSGKSTQSKKLVKYLEQAGPVKWMCFPNRATPIGILIDLYLQKKIELGDEAVHLLFSANRWEIANSIVADLRQGTCVICDRYAFSGVAYSAAKGLNFGWCRAPDCGLPCPDGVFFLHIDEKVGASRSNFGDERYENANMQAKVREEFRQARIRDGVAWHDVDGARDMEVIHSEICAAAEQIRKEGQQNDARPLHRLWMRGCDGGA